MKGIVLLFSHWYLSPGFKEKYSEEHEKAFSGFNPYHTEIADLNPSTMGVISQTLTVE
jgi:hypothetical protein